MPSEVANGEERTFPVGFVFKNNKNKARGKKLTADSGSGRRFQPSNLDGKWSGIGSLTRNTIKHYF